MRLISTFIFTVSVLLTGCAAQIQKGITDLDMNWAATNAVVVQEIGTRYYKADKEKAQRGMLLALSNLGLLVEQQDSRSGFINARGNAPLPLSSAEWERVVAIELPNARAITGSSRLELSAKNREVVINTFILEREQGDIQINLRMRVKYMEKTPGIVVGDQPPPEAVRLGVRKIFDEFEKVGFVQQIILDKR